MSRTEAYPLLMSALAEVRGQWRLQKLLEGMLLALAGVLGVLTVLVAADNLLQPDLWGRVVLAGVLWGSLAAFLLNLVVRRFLEDRRDDYFAALVEQKHPELRNQLINALQLGRGDQKGFSPGLIDAIIRDAGHVVAELHASDSVDARPARRAAAWALVALLAIGGYAAALTPRFTNGLQRVLLPVSDIAPYTRTRIVDESVVPGNKRFPEGAAVAVEARVSGVIPAKAELHRRGANGAWLTNTMLPDKDGSATFRFVLSQAAESFEYYLTAGDARSKSYRVEVVKPPQVAEMTVAYNPPAYTGLAPLPPARTDGEISGIAGTRVEVELRPTKALKEAGLKLKSGEVLTLEKRGDDQAWGCAFVIWSGDARPAAEVSGKLVNASTTYQVRLLDTDGYENADPVWRNIALVKDQAPVVNVLAPGDRLSVKPDTTLPLTVEARDDFGLGEVRLLYRVNNDEKAQELARFPHDGKPELKTHDPFEWRLSSGKLKANDRVEYWAEAVDRNVITGPSKAESRHLTLELVSPAAAVAKLDLNVSDYAQLLEALLKLQRENRAQTPAAPFPGLVQRQTLIRDKTRELARIMEKDNLPVVTIIQALDNLAAGLMAEALKLLESGRTTEKESRANEFRAQSLPVQDKIIAELEALLARLQRNEQAKKALKKMEKKDPAGHKQVTAVLAQMIKDLDKLLKDQTELADKFERLPKKPDEERREESLKAVKDLEDLKKRAEKWAKGAVNELTKLPGGFVEDFQMRPDVNKVYEEIEKAANRSKAEKAEVALEDLGAALATKMKEDLEMWMPDSPDNLKWVLEEPLDKKPMKIPEMPLPKALEDLVGELLQRADEFDEEADDVTSAWGDNLDQAGWGVGDGPISTFSAKGKTGNDQPNNMEVSGRSGDGRRGKSSGQMVGDTARGLPGRKTPARVGAEKYEPGQLKQEGQEDPNGVTGGGKVAGAGNVGLQGGTPPNLHKDMGRLSEKQAGLREKAEKVAQKLETVGVSTRRLNESIELMKSVEKDLSDHRYDDIARKKRDAMQKLRTAFTEMDPSTAFKINRARDLPPQLRNELLQSADEGYPAGYEGLLKSYYKALSTAEK